jgi:hypothetical protein
MGCQDCDKFQQEGKVFYYRFGTANIGIIACERHFREVRELLNKSYLVVTNDKVEPEVKQNDSP